LNAGEIAAYHTVYITQQSVIRQNVFYMRLSKAIFLLWKKFLRTSFCSSQLFHHVFSNPI